MSKQDLKATLARMSEHTTPPAYIFREALSAYEDYVKEIELEIDKLKERVRAEVSFQRTIREDERKHRAEQYERHQEEKRNLVKQIGHAAAVYNRILEAKNAGKKTIRLDTLDTAA